MTQVEIGQVVATRGVADWMQGTHEVAVARAVWRHRTRDWGKVCPEDKATNDEAVRDGNRLLSCYEVGGRDLWVITEWDRSVTTIHFPEEY